jgi:hypothetical protein
MQRKLQVFLCHASEDKPIVYDLYERLRSENWIYPWLDNEKILPGQDWDLEIEKAIGKADVIIICLSRISVNKEGYVQKEINHALDISKKKLEGTIYIIPLKLEDCEVPRSLAEKHWVPYYESKAFDRLTEALAERMRQIEDSFRVLSSEKSDFEFICDICGKIIDSHKNEGIVYIISNDLLNAEKTSEELSTRGGLIPANQIRDSIARWRISHYSCNPNEDTYYEIEVYRMKTFPKLIAWTSHLMWKKWLYHTDWQIFISMLAKQSDANLGL